MFIEWDAAFFRETGIISVTVSAETGLGRGAVRHGLAVIQRFPGFSTVIPSNGC